MTAGAATDIGDKAKVFISYSRKDIAFADRLEATLRANDVEPLLDRSEIYAFEDWWKRIQALISQADTFVFIISPDALSSDICRKEIAFAASLNKRFAPVVFRRVDDKAVPEELARLNFIFFTDEPLFDSSSERLVEALRTDINWVREHTAFGEAARRWSAAGRPGGLLLRSPVLEEAERWIAVRPAGAPAPTEETQTYIAESRQGATRRRNILTGSLAGGLIVALVLAALAYSQRGIAVEQREIAVTERDKATRNFRLAQKAADSLVVDIARGLRDAQGMRADVVRKILEAARVTLEQLAAAAPDDPELQRSRAAMLHEFGDTYIAVGDLGAALAVQREAVSIAERFLAADRSDTLWQRVLSVSYGKVGDVLVAQGQYDEAIKLYRDSLEIAERLAIIDPGNAQWQGDLSLAYLRLGTMQRDRDEALKLLGHALSIAERVVAADPDNPEWQSILSGLHDKIGDVLLSLDKLDEALKSYRDSLAVAERLVAADPDNTQWQRGLSVAHHKLGAVLAGQGKLEDALNAYRDSLAIAERLAAADRSNAGWQRDLSVAHGVVGDVLFAQGKLDEALNAYRNGLAIMKRLAAVDSSNLQWQDDLSGAYGNIGEVLVKQGKLGDALDAYRESLAIIARLAAAYPDHARLQKALQARIEEIGSLAYRFILARDFTRGLEVADQAISLSPGTIWLHNNRAHALMLLGRVGEARSLYLKYRGEQDAHGGKSWEIIVLQDFADMRKTGLAHPLMDEIEATFNVRG